jgi:hypothetical protein
MHREVSHPGAAMTGQHTCQPSTFKARFRAGVCRTRTFESGLHQQKAPLQDLHVVFDSYFA